MNKPSFLNFSAVITSALLLGGCALQNPSPSAPQQGDPAKPILTGTRLPRMILRTSENEKYDLNQSISRKPTVLIFYRGGWCPFCNRHLAALQKIEPELAALGYQIIAVSPDRPEKLLRPVEKHGVKYLLLSDSKMEAAQSLGLAFKVDDATVLKYKTEYGIDIEADSGETHHLLPIPAALVLDTNGMIRFAYSNPDYKTRIKTTSLLHAAKRALQP